MFAKQIIDTPSFLRRTIVLLEKRNKDMKKKSRTTKIQQLHCIYFSTYYIHNKGISHEFDHQTYGKRSGVVTQKTNNAL